MLSYIHMAWSCCVGDLLSRINWSSLIEGYSRRNSGTPCGINVLALFSKRHTYHEVCALYAGDLAFSLDSPEPKA
jgi:hypothetical protein